MLRIALLSAEMQPYVRVGGLSDIADSLPRALRAQGVEVLRLAPLTQGVGDRYELEEVFRIDERGCAKGLVFRVKNDPIETYFLLRDGDNPHGPTYHQDSMLDGARFAWFGFAAIHFLSTHLSAKPIDLLHAHDWHAGAAIHFAIDAQHKGLLPEAMPTLFTVHNAPYQGPSLGEFLAPYGLTASRDLLHTENANDTFLRAAARAATAVSTVSEGYGRELLEPNSDQGLSDVLFARRRAGLPELFNIRNGIDDRKWDPSGDALIAQIFDVQRIEKREANRQALRKQYFPHLPAHAPLLGIVSRLVHQKGIDIALEALAQLEKSTASPFGLLVLGEGESALEERLHHLARVSPDRYVFVRGYQEELSRKMFAGIDFLLVPSRYEPCGLVQMYAMRYGAVPIATECGGLADTVMDAGLSREATGFSSPEGTARSYRFAVARALFSFGSKLHLDLQKNGMNQDFSQAKMAREYIALYRALSEQNPVDQGSAAVSKPSEPISKSSPPAKRSHKKTKGNQA